MGRLPWWLRGKESACNAGDLGLIPGLGRSLGEGNRNPLQYSGLGNLGHRGTWWATVQRLTKSQMRLSDLAHIRFGQVPGCSISFLAPKTQILDKSEVVMPISQRHKLRLGWVGMGSPGGPHGLKLQSSPCVAPPHTHFVGLPVIHVGLAATQVPVLGNLFGSSWATEPHTRHTYPGREAGPTP